MIFKRPRSGKFVGGPNPRLAFIENGVDVQLQQVSF